MRRDVYWKTKQIALLNIPQYYFNIYHDKYGDWYQAKMIPLINQRIYLIRSGWKVYLMSPSFLINYIHLDMVIYQVNVITQ